MSEKRDNCVYFCYCPDTGEGYVGRTKHPKKRYVEHLRDHNSAVYKMAQKSSYGVVMLLVKRGLTHDEACAYEAKYFYENYFKFILKNVQFPGVGNLKQFLTKNEQAKWHNLMSKIDADQKSQTPRVKYCNTRGELPGPLVDYLEDVIASRELELLKAAKNERAINNGKMY